MRVDTPVSVERNTSLASSALAAAPAPAETSDQAVVAVPLASVAAEPGVKITLSMEGLARSKEKDKNKDIDESDLPMTIKELLKMIRELKMQLAQKMAELQAIMQSDTDDETRQASVQALQNQVSSISGALSSASAQLVKAMRDSGLSQQQSATVSSLMSS
ncbi:hypothetical protein BVH03_14895 [Pseudomonas sp. PA15(2017)]|uniref:hypothetical protein n=1 Tax=Pseudomonas sp. PA15(2017) TaxID=1932111 RepID=UPI000964646C|nr:hypothetical protein [Pseudomonas sp. PA15(2017)]OLU27493.1 hypothetical protein BVH03_14895 [Pseudomonas sp. PA15(2017)]